MQLFGDTRFLSISELTDFVDQSRLDAAREDSLLEFELRDQPRPYFCKWHGLNAHKQGECTHGN